MFRKLFAAGLVAIALAGCAMLPDSPATIASKKAVGVVLTTYVEVYQPAVLTYGRLPDCPGATICKDRAVLEALKAADLVAINSIKTAQAVMKGTIPDTGQLPDLVAAIQNAEVKIASSGAMGGKVTP